MNDGPSPEEIAEATAKIRAGWSEADRRARAKWAYTHPVETDTVGMGLFGLLPDYDRFNF